MTFPESFYQIGSKTDRGKYRDENQDAIGYFSDLEKSWMTLILCDGMGGHRGGSKASNLAVEKIGIYFQNHFGDVPPEILIREAIISANSEIFEAGNSDPELKGMGTTVALILATSDGIWYGNVGDSRIYLISSKEIKQLSKDHTTVQKLLENGIITEEEAQNHPDSNILSRCVGAKSAVDPDVYGPIKLENNQFILQCSDGLYNFITENILQKFVTEKDPQSAVSSLIDEANQNDGTDNISVQILKKAEEKTEPVSQKSGRLFSILKKYRFQLLIIFGILIIFSIGAIVGYLLNEKTETITYIENYKPLPSPNFLKKPDSDSKRNVTPDKIDNNNKLTEPKKQPAPKKEQKPEAKKLKKRKKEQKPEAKKGKERKKEQKPEAKKPNKENKDDEDNE